MKDTQCMLLAITVDKGYKRIMFDSEFDYKKARLYVSACKKLIKHIDQIMSYAVYFKNRKFANIVELAKACNITFDKEIEALAHPTFDIKTLKALGVLNVDFKERFVELDPKLSKLEVIGILRLIPTLLMLRIKHGNRVYNSVASLAKEEFKQGTTEELILLTNYLAQDIYKKQQEGLSEDDD